MLSVPMPARPTIFKFFAFLKTSSVTCVAERIASPSNLPISFNNSSLLNPGIYSVSILFFLKTFTADSLNLSLMRTFGLIPLSFLFYF